MVSSTSRVQLDFERIALLDHAGWDHNQQYHAFLLRFVPRRRRAALEVGCGTGGFARCLAAEFARVLAVDLAPEMIRRARDLSPAAENIEFRVGDLRACDLPPGGFDCVATIATLHHLPLEETIEKIVAALAPGGVLLVLDLYQPRGIADWIWSAAAVPCDLLLRVWKVGRLREPPHVRQAWTEHACHDTYSTLPEIRAIAARLLPGAAIRRHLFWRYSLVWTKQPMA